LGWCVQQQKPLPVEKGQTKRRHLASHLPEKSAGIGTLASARLPRLHRAGPSASLDKSMLAASIVNDRFYTTPDYPCQVEKSKSARRITPANPLRLQKVQKTQNLYFFL
jgi:hypothetical protein